MRYLLFIFVFFFLLLNLNAQQKKIRLLFAGDAMQHQSQINAARTNNGYNYSSYFKHIKEYIDSADIAVVNLEVTLAGKPYTGYPSFSAPEDFAEELKHVGFDVFLTANNHILDKGGKGLLRTLAQLDSMRVKHLGSYADINQKNLRYPMMLIKNGIRIAMLNYTYDTNGRKAQAPNIVNYIEKDSISKDINLAKRMHADVIIANMHWGIEYKLAPNKEQKELAEFLIENGVHIIVGSHPHVVQPVDIRRENDTIKNIIVYSLGNLVSGMKAINTDGGMITTIDISKDENNLVKIDNCDYSLVWVYKPIEEGKMNMQLIPVNEYENEQVGIKFLGEDNYNKMMLFARTAKSAVEKMWNEEK